MVDLNVFKKDVKEWIKVHPEGTLTELRDYCEDQIPSAQFAAYEWLVDQTVGWYKHILDRREIPDDEYDLVD